MAWNAKPTVKADVPVLAVCKLADCLFHEGNQDASVDICRCSHPHKAREARTQRCSLYQMDFMKKMAPMLRAK